jgi:exonuclease VII large subunit
MNLSQEKPGFEIMKMKKLVGIFLLSNIAMPAAVNYALFLSTNPAMAASVSVNHHTTSSTLLADIKTKYVKDADENLNLALEAMNNAADTESNEDAAQYFDTAMEHLKNAATALKKGGMGDSANKIENAIQALNDAVETDSEKQQDKLIEKAIDSLNQVDEALKAALN